MPQYWFIIFSKHTTWIQFFLWWKRGIFRKLKFLLVLQKYELILRSVCFYMIMSLCKHRRLDLHNGEIFMMSLESLDNILASPSHTGLCVDRSMTMYAMRYLFHVMISIHSQLDWLWNHLGDIYFRVCLEGCFHKGLKNK